MCTLCDAPYDIVRKLRRLRSKVSPRQARLERCSQVGASPEQKVGKRVRVDKDLLVVLARDAGHSLHPEQHVAYSSPRPLQRRHHAPA